MVIIQVRRGTAVEWVGKSLAVGEIGFENDTGKFKIAVTGTLTWNDLPYYEDKGTSVNNTAYDAGTWDNNLDAATKNAIRDKIETMNTAIGLNTAKDTNVTTNLSNGAVNATTYVIESSDGTNVTMVEATTALAGLLSADKWDEIVANTAKDTNVPMATDPLWDAAGDLAVGTGANTAVVLSKGDNGQVLTLVAGTPAWTAAGAPGFHHDTHDPENGTDALDCAAPSELASVQAAGEGSAHEFARADHAHQIQESMADNHLVTVNDADAAADDYTKFTATGGLEGRSYAEVKSDLDLEIGTDVLAQQTIGIGDGNLVDIDAAAGVAADDYTKFTATGLVGLSDTEVMADLSSAAGADFSMNSNKITSVTDPTADQDAATKAYVDSVAAGLDPKESCDLATTAVLPDCVAAGSEVGKTLTDNSAQGIVLTIDSVNVALNDRILVKNQANKVDNGIYTVTTLGVLDTTKWVLTRATDADTDLEVTAGMFTFVAEGTVNKDQGWVLITNDPVEVDTDDLEFSQFSGAGTIVAGDGLTKTGDTINAVGGTGLTAVADAINHDAHTGDVTGATELTIAAGAVETAMIGDDEVTYTKMQNVAADDRILGNNGGAGTVIQELTAAEVLAIIDVESGADVTDAANVDAAGATMNTDADVKANSWTIDENDMVSDLDTKVPTQQSVKYYVDTHNIDGGSA